MPVRSSDLPTQAPHLIHVKRWTSRGSESLCINSRGRSNGSLQLPTL